MSIIITGLEMPTERESFNLTIKYNGMVLDTETGIQVAEAHELPPCGRLIDVDAALRDGWTISRTYSASPTEMVYEAKAIDCLPIIIPAEEEHE